ncbi:MAG: RHS repeat-associated core domain-containing protein, partial [Bacteroidota bacterium]
DIIDDLSYTYEGNQLRQVSDSAGTAGFKDGNNAGDDYAYDANGNMTRDLNKGITRIEYNHLNLPTRVDWEAGRYQLTTYDANGIKLQKRDYKADTLHKTIDYVGEFVYVTEGSGQTKLKQISHDEGRVVPLDDGSFSYEYHLKDHLGNVRVTFSTTPENYEMIETFESGEDNGFQDLQRFTNSNANTTSGGNEVARLQSGDTGGMIFLSMNKGDTVNLTVNANYESTPSNNNFLGTGYNALFSSFDAVYGSGIENGVTSSSSVFDDALSGIDMSDKGNSSTAPRAFLNYIRFDKDMNYVSAGFLQISTAAQGIGVHETISLNDIIADREGYILAYLSNENAAAVNVHFDDFTVYHGKTNVVFTSDYYPFGYGFNEYNRTASVPQNFRFNSFELDENTGWYDYLARQYDPLIGRFTSVDPAADLMRRHSPYNYAFDNPIRFIDPDGMMPDEIIDGSAAGGGSTSRTITSAGNTDYIDEVTTSTTTTRSVVDSSDPDYQAALEQSGIDPSNLSGEAWVTQTTTTTTTSGTVLEYDDSGNLISENTTDFTLTESQKSVTFKDTNGGDGGGAIINKEANVTYDQNASPSDAVSAKINDAVSYRSANGVSVTNGQDNASAIARQQNAINNIDKYSPAAGALVLRYASLGSLAFSAATYGVTKSLERGLQFLKSDGAPCNNCTKTFK